MLTLLVFFGEPKVLGKDREHPGAIERIAEIVDD